MAENPPPYEGKLPVSFPDFVGFCVSLRLSDEVVSICRRNEIAAPEDFDLQVELLGLGLPLPAVRKIQNARKVARDTANQSPDQAKPKGEEKAKKLEWINFPVLELLTDAGGWHEAIYYEGIRALGAVGRLFVFARGRKDLVLTSFHPAESKWVQHPRLSALGDKENWQFPQFRKTLSIVSLADKIFVICRGSEGLCAISFNCSENTWKVHTQVCSLMRDSGGWITPVYYETIRVVSACGKVYVVGRGANSTYLVCFDPSTEAWTILPSLNMFTDAQGWNQPQYYSTFRVVSVADKIFVFGRGIAELLMVTFDITTNQWTNHARYTFMTDKGGWDNPVYYEGIHLLPLAGELFVFGRGLSTLHLTSYNPLTNKWSDYPPFPYFGDLDGWSAPAYRCTVQATVIDENVLVFGRGMNGLNLVSFNPHTNKWREHPGYATMTDAENWHRPQHYLTIKAVPVAGQLYVLGRGSDGLHLVQHMGT